MANGTLAASQIEMLSQSGTGIITITPPATNTNRAITLPDAAGAIVVSGTTPSLNGITFPATQVASADANTLDDYEEGTFTATANPASGSITFVAGVNGSYRKIGGCVTCLINLEVSAISSPSGRLRIESLPFTATSQPSVFFMALTAGNSGYGNVIRGDIQVAATNIFADRIIDSVQTLDVAGACKVGTFISASFSYFVA